MQIQQSLASLIGGAIQNIGLDAPPPPDAPGGRRTDKIRRSHFPSWPSPPGATGGLNSILSQLMSLLQQLLSALGNTNTMQPFFNTAQASSTGDPHLAFDGMSAAGAQQSRFDSMDDHPDLLDSNSFQGGFQIGTSVTQPGANGVTWNRRAAVTTNFGSTEVSLDNNGVARVLRNGKSVEVAAGQSMRVGPWLYGPDINRSGAYIDSAQYAFALGARAQSGREPLSICQEYTDDGRTPRTWRQ